MSHFRQAPSYNYLLFFTIIGLMILGAIMITSSSISIIEGKPYYFAEKEAYHLCFALILFCITLCIPIQIWFKYNFVLLALTVLLLAAVFFVSKPINGASRWIPLGFFNFQPSELAKLAFFGYLAAYMAKRYKKVRWSIKEAYIKPLLILFILAGLILKQPDLGTMIVITCVMFALILISGANFVVFTVMFLGFVCAGGALIYFVAYRFVRLIAFLDPWQDPQNSGYQLVNSLMAIGNGGFWGNGLGNSTLKLDYLPEHHTDFIFSILSEELGYAGVLLTVFLFVVFVYQSFKISRSLNYRALQQEERTQLSTESGVVYSLFASYFAFEIGMWVAIQALINFFVTAGLFPTKGLTLPFISYGGSSLLIMAIASAILLRIDYEARNWRSN